MRLKINDWSLSPWTVAPLVAVGALLFSPSLAAADTVMLMMQSGPENGDRMTLLSAELEGAGHTAMIPGASYEDSALMMGCEASADACLDSVIEMGGADAAVIIPQDAGALRVRREGANKSSSIAAGATDYDWKVALSQAYGLPAPSPPPELEKPPGADFSDPDPGGGFQLSNVKLRSWIVLGSGVAASGVGLVFMSLASSKQDEVDSHPVDTAADFDALSDLESTGKTYAQTGNFFVVAGGIATLTGVGLAILDMKSGAGESGPVLVPSASESSVGVSIHWGNL